MKAAIIIKFGNPEVLEIQEVSIPQSKADEVLIRNYSNSINTGNVIYYEKDHAKGRIITSIE